MQLNVTTDYAIRTVLYLGQCKKIASATEISNEMGIPRGYLEKVLSIRRITSPNVISFKVLLSRKAVDFCAVRRYYAKVQEKLETQFFSISLKEILEQEGA